MSSVSPFLHFGLGATEKVDSIIIQWPTGEKTIESIITANQIHTISDPKTDNQQPTTDNRQPTTDNRQLTNNNTLLTHRSTNQNDFSYQRTLPFSYSHLGPLVAVSNLQDDKKVIIAIDESRDFIKLYAVSYTHLTLPTICSV